MDAYQCLYKIVKLLQPGSYSLKTTLELMAYVITHTRANIGVILTATGEPRTWESVCGNGRLSELVPPTVVWAEEICQGKDMLERCFEDDRHVIMAPIHIGRRPQPLLYLERETPFDTETSFFVSEFVSLAGAAIGVGVARMGSSEDSEALPTSFCGIHGQHPCMLDLYKTVRRVAPSKATVLIQGETGTGKELVARAIHQNSDRADKPFIPILCGAIPGDLFEAELFGHTRGAFTGAGAAREGRIMQAHGGTLFIDEIGELPLFAQAKLLRFFQFGEMQKVGSDRVEKVDVRLIAASHRDLAKMVRNGSFREDLFYRIKVVELTLPPLRERKTDLPLLIDYFLEKYMGPAGRDVVLTAKTLSTLFLYDFPGNVRELAHMVERLCVLASSKEIGSELLPAEVHQSGDPLQRQGSAQEWNYPFHRYTNEELKELRELAMRQVVTAVERDFLQGLMQRYKNNISQAAAGAGMQRTYLHKLMARHRQPNG